MALMEERERHTANVFHMLFTDLLLCTVTDEEILIPRLIPICGIAIVATMYTHIEINICSNISENISSIYFTYTLYTYVYTVGWSLNLILMNFYRAAPPK